MKPWVKVCGVRTVEAIEVAAAAGADAVGFVFHEPSPRHLGFDEARALADAVPAGVAKVAVFLRPSQAMLDAAVAAVRPDWVQADVDDLAALHIPQGVRTLPVLRAGGDARAVVGRRFLYEGALSGAGERADWHEAARLAGTGELVLAGGLDADNAATAIEAVRPFGVDVSSGVESSRGVKDPARIRAFLAAIDNIFLTGV